MIKCPARFMLWLAAMVLCIPPVNACPLVVADAWIREAPPGLMTLAGYARLKNNSNQPITIAKVESAVFAEVQIHESSIENGMASMHAIDALRIAANEQVILAPGGKHLMLMGASGALKPGDKVQITFRDDHQCSTPVQFEVRRAAAEK